MGSTAEFVFTVVETGCCESVVNALFSKAQLTVIDELRDKYSHAGNIVISAALIMIISVNGRILYNNFSVHVSYSW